MFICGKDKLIATPFSQFVYHSEDNPFSEDIVTQTQRMCDTIRIPAQNHSTTPVYIVYLW